MFVPLATNASTFIYANEITTRFRFDLLRLNLVQAVSRLKARHSSEIVCSSAPAILSRQATEERP